MNKDKLDDGLGPSAYSVNGSGACKLPNSSIFLNTCSEGIEEWDQLGEPGDERLRDGRIVAAGRV
jgi:hypothetical protein